MAPKKENPAFELYVREQGRSEWYGSEEHMDEERRKHPAKRELTYRVGWKKGKFEVGENGRVTASETAVVFMEKAMWQRLLEHVVWRKVPNMPLSGMTGLLFGLPVVTFGLTWWLVRLLSKV